MHPPLDPAPLSTLPYSAPVGKPTLRDLEGFLTAHLDRVDRQLRRSLRGPGTAVARDPVQDRLWRSLSQATHGGKRFRPALLAVAYRAWGGRDEAAAAAVGAAVELLHTAFVVHDDVIDGDLTRRGRPSVLGAHIREAKARGVASDRAHEYGIAAGVLAGDLALATAMRTVASCPAEPSAVRRLLDLFDEVLRVSAEGELSDVWLGVGGTDPTVDDTLLVAQRKTAEYSFALPLQAAAVLAGTSRDAVQAAGDVGRCLGTAYQLVDDLQGVFGDPCATGKSRLSDLRSGKQTALVAHARTTAAWPALAPYVGRATLTEPDAEAVRGLLVASGSRAYVEGLAVAYVDRAVGLARRSGTPEALVSWFTGLSGDLLRSVA